MSTPDTVHVGHGTWISGSDLNFDNHGTFVFWVETPCSRKSSSRSKVRPHPGHLDTDTMLEFLSSGPMFGKAVLVRLKPEPATFYATLPSIGKAPLPSIEMARMQGEFLPGDTDGYEWHDWEIRGLAVSRPLLFLKELRYATLSGQTDFRLGSDLGFWIRYARMFRNMVADHRFLPTMKCFQPGRKGSRVQIVSGWSPASGQYEDALSDFALAMPGICRTVSTRPSKGRRTDPPEGLSSMELLRHFSEQQLDQLVADARIALSNINRFNGHWPAPALAHPGQHRLHTGHSAAPAR